MIFFGKRKAASTEIMHHINHSKYLLAQTNCLINAIFWGIIHQQLRGGSSQPQSVAFPAICYARSTGMHILHIHSPRQGGESQDFSQNQMTERERERKAPLKDVLPCD